MAKRLPPVFLLLMLGVDASSAANDVGNVPKQPVTDELVVYERGNMPVIVLVPHDGTVKPEGLPLMNNATRDVNASPLARSLCDQLAYTDSKGEKRRPHLVINLASRAVTEPNISWEENTKRGWFDSDGMRRAPPTRAECIHRDFHACADYAVRMVQAQHGRGLLVDLHGLGAQVPLDMYGYLIRGERLRSTTGDGPSTDEALAKHVREASTLQYAASRKTTDRDVAELIRGPKSLASLVDHAYRTLYPKLTDEDGQPRGRAATPSAQFRNPTGEDSPIHGKVYFTGAYDIRAHSSLQNGINVDAVQIETMADARDNDTLRLRFARCMTLALREFLRLHYDLDMTPPAPENR